jgi:hypothetical protein
MDFDMIIASDFVLTATTSAGVGVFKNNETAIEMAGRLSKNSRRAYSRYGMVDPLFFQCLAELNVIGKGVEIPKHAFSLDRMKELLSETFLKHRLTTEDLNQPDLRGLAGQQSSHLWYKIINEISYMKHVKRPR